MLYSRLGKGESRDAYGMCVRILIIVQWTPVITRLSGPTPRPAVYTNRAITGFNSSVEHNVLHVSLACC